ncbi:LytTR family DNA-binding domain-containing protein [Ruminococcaceae bacterium OttesenSCG-928-A16]|nr:LytTR family DNA-binding domain-containing protein [Ruminococcaceae bacterium OttesenSCG-928-A16]
MFRICICDDEPMMRTTLYNLLDDALSRHKLEYHIYEVADARELLSSPRPIDMLFMDIQFGKDKIGFDVAKQLRENDEDLIITFLTSYQDYMADSFKLDTFRYILKPAKPKDIEETIDSLINKLDARVKTIAAKTEFGVQLVNIREIAYIEINKRHSKMVMQTGETIAVKESLNDLVLRLPKQEFDFPQVSYLVNLRHISNIKNNVVTMMDGQTITIGRKFKDAFMKAFHNSAWEN